MQKLFIPEIERLARDEPLLYEIFQKVIKAVNATPVLTGKKSPEGGVAAPPGTLYLSSQPLLGDSVYVKESGQGKAGWRALVNSGSGVVRTKRAFSGTTSAAAFTTVASTEIDVPANTRKLEFTLSLTGAGSARLKMGGGVSNEIAASGVAMLAAPPKGLQLLEVQAKATAGTVTATLDIYEAGFLAGNQLAGAREDRQTLGVPKTATLEPTSLSADALPGPPTSPTARTHGGVVLADGVDFSFAYLNKHLGNVPDDAVSGRRGHTVNTLVNRPAAGTAGRLYHATDVGANGTTYRDTGTAWVKVGVGHLGDADGTVDNISDGATFKRVGGVSSANLIQTASVSDNAITGNGFYANDVQQNFGTSSTEFVAGTVTITTNGGFVFLLGKIGTPGGTIIQIRKDSVTGTILDGTGQSASSTLIGLDSTPAASQTYVITIKGDAVSPTTANNVRLLAVNSKK